MTKATARHRQWGTEKVTDPLPHLHEQPNSTKLAWSRIAIIVTILFWLTYVLSTVFRQLYNGPTYQFTLEAWEYLIVVTFLTFSSLMYLVARQGALQRFARHVRVPRAILDQHFSHKSSAITVLIPSYDEEPEVIRKTLLSAALQEYPQKRVVLLIDDDPKKAEPTKLAATKALAASIEELLRVPARKFARALTHFERKLPRNPTQIKKSTATLIAHYKWASEWLRKMAEKEKVEDHVDNFFATQVLGELANDLQLVAEALKSAEQDGVAIATTRLHQLYRRLAWIFRAEVTFFERKRYASLSHESNKAMNLNSYIGLMGGKYIEEVTPDGLILTPTKREKEATVTIPDSEFVLTLDADSILLKDYCLRLVYFLEQPDNADVAVTQTPYSSFRGAATRIERLSGATTDIQHILHQGMSYYGATFWVGANAVIRKSALMDIAEREYVGGYEIKRFIQDRTVIEDTESSIDLALHGWRLVNYPERLSYSATPPDFGSLVIQRRRWANGGLLIIPKLWVQIRERKNKRLHVPLIEVLLRINYMASIAWANFGLIFLLAYPYDGRLLSPFVLLAAMPYFIAMASDLKYCRYNYWDVIRIYGFNLILLPVNLAGVLKSLEQALTSKKMPFARTPKVKNRTSVGLPYLLAPLFIVGFSLFTFWRNVESANWGNAILAGFNAWAATSAIVGYIGVGNLLVDIWVGITDLLYVEVKEKRKAVKASKKRLNWKAILYHGEVEGELSHYSAQELLARGRN